MLKIQFDTDAYKTNAIAGPFESRAVLETACVKMSPDDPAYRTWAVKHGADPASGSIITSAYNPDLLDRRYQTLSAQLTDFIGAKQGAAPASGLSHQVPANLRDALESATQPNKILMISSTRENLHFDLQEIFPGRGLQTVTAAIDADYADKCNDLIRAKAPELSDALTYKSEWQKDSFDVVAVNPAALYHDEAGLKELVESISNTGATRVVFSNLVPNDDENGAAQWKTQRYNGGVIPFRVPARGELVSLMQAFNYRLVDEAKAPASFDLNKANSFAAQNPALDNLSFIRG